MINKQELQGQWQSVRGKVKEKWGQLTDDDLMMAGGNVDQVIGRIQQRTGEAKGNIEKFINDLVDPSTVQRVKDTAVGYATDVADKARESYDQLRERATDGYDQLRDQAQKGYGQAEQMVRQHPAESMAAVFGLGVITGVVVGLLLRSE